MHLFEQVQTALTDAIQTELLKRGFTARITVNPSKAEEGSRFKISSEPFNTTPVIMKSIRITGTVTVIDDSVKAIVGVEYDHFDGGCNGTELFRIFGRIYKDGGYVQFLQNR